MKNSHWPVCMPINLLMGEVPISCLDAFGGILKFSVLAFKVLLF